MRTHSITSTVVRSMLSGVSIAFYIGCDLGNNRLGSKIAEPICILVFRPGRCQSEPYPPAPLLLGWRRSRSSPRSFSFNLIRFAPPSGKSQRREHSFQDPLSPIPFRGLSHRGLTRAQSRRASPVACAAVSGRRRIADSASILASASAFEERCKSGSTHQPGCRALLLIWTRL
jgi:hypothetical protein